jgi:T4 RnlA family RNA ligase
MNINILNTMMEQGYVMKNKHPNSELYIYNYTQMAQYESIWNETTIQCRGLILDNEYNIVARPFPKFFNLSEHQPEEIPNLPFKVYDKLDGSLGILYFWNDVPSIATRGSFDSIQSNKANEILQQKYQKVLPLLNRNFTYLFEIIYPENRIVLDYGNLEDIILLEIIETKTGKQMPLEDIGFSIVKQYDQWQNIEELKQLNIDNKEGFVLKYENGFRVKIKFEEYVRLHRIITQCSSLDIWECLKNNTPLNEFLNNVPDEFFDWIKQTEKNLKTEFETIENDCKNYFKVFDTPRETAEYFLKHPHQSVLFSMLKNKNYNEIIWKKIRPKFEKPFVNKIENEN